MRRRYLWMTTSIFFLDLAILLVFRIVSNVWSGLWLSGGVGVALLLAANWLVADRVFVPIRRFLKGELRFDDVQRRLTQLPLRAAGRDGRARSSRRGRGVPDRPGMSVSPQEIAGLRRRYLWMAV